MLVWSAMGPDWCKKRERLEEEEGELELTGDVGVVSDGSRLV